MNLIIDKEFNQLHSILSSFLIISNHKYFRVQMEEKWNIQLDNEMKRTTEKLLENNIFQEGKHLVDMEGATRDIFINLNLIYKSKDIDEYLKRLEGQGEKDLRDSIFKSLDIYQLIKNERENYLIIALEEISKIDFQDEVKWYLISLIKDPKFYIRKFINLIKEYLPIFEGLKNKYWRDYENFVKWIDEKLEVQGIDFLDEYLNFINLKQYDEIHLNYSIFDLISSHYLEDGKAYIYIGLVFKKYVEKEREKHDIDKHLNIYKVLSDRTRFDIIKILINKESYGQEIAEKLGISTATVSYHMDFLFGASLIFIKRKSRRLYYSVNKEQVKNSMDFLERELDL